MNMRKSFGDIVFATWIGIIAFFPWVIIAVVLIAACFSL